MGVNCQLALVQAIRAHPVSQQDRSIQSQGCPKPHYQIRLLRFPRRHYELARDKQILHEQVRGSEPNSLTRNLRPFHKRNRYRSSQSHHGFRSGYDHPTQPPEINTLNHMLGSISGNRNQDNTEIVSTILGCAARPSSQPAFYEKRLRRVSTILNFPMNFLLRVPHPQIPPHICSSSSVQ
jgi:hypothetical protein